MTSNKAVAALSVAACLVGVSADAACRDNRVTVHGDWGRANFTVDVADDNAERSQGLMFVEEMGVMEGMLFVYDAPRPANFWMRNTLISLDMLFARADGTITALHENAVPLDETGIDGGDNVSFVLEINGGMASRLGIEVGDILQHPSITEDAVMSCDE